MRHIELFAGCGGLALGMEKAGFETLLANELSPMAAETFAFNILGDNLQDNPEQVKHTFWLSSNFPRGAMQKRLRENPYTYPEGLNSDIPSDISRLKGGLIIGNIKDFNAWLASHPKELAEIKESFGEGEVDLVSGGPPCQSFSLAGLREKNNEKNSLPWAFSNFVQMIQPKVSLLENVSGILRPFTEGGSKYYAWFEVAKAFASIGYVPLPLHVNAKFAGVAQSRPRFILISVREDFFKSIQKKLNAAEKDLFASSVIFYRQVKQGKAVSLDSLTVHDLNKGDTKTEELFEKSFLSPLLVRKDHFVSVRDAIDDLGSGDKPQSAFVRNLNETFSSVLLKDAENFDKSHRLIENQARVKRRFRIYQVMSLLPRETSRQISSFLIGKTTAIDDSVWRAVKEYDFLSLAGKMKKFRGRAEFERYLSEHLTKKQVQRALVASDPAPAALSIPDDACHYSELRTLTAREMARIQSFPDNFIFRSKMTTGGQNRRFEVPIYTQIGNAVPVLLGYALGLCVKKLLSKAQ